MNRLLGHIKWLLRSRRTRQLDAQAMIIADKYGMRKQYLEARKFGLSPLEALEDWDMVDLEEMKNLIIRKNNHIKISAK